MRAISTKGAAALAAGALLLLPGAPMLAAPGDLTRSPRPGTPAYKRPWIGEACKQEFSELCSSLPSGARRETIVECLKQHADSLSPSCNEAISDRPHGMEAGSQGRRGGRHGRPTPQDAVDQ